MVRDQRTALMGRNTYSGLYINGQCGWVGVGACGCVYVCVYVRVGVRVSGCACVYVSRL